MYSPTWQVIFITPYYNIFLYDIQVSGDKSVRRNTHDITMSDDVAGDAHCDITMGNDVTRDM